LGPIGNKVTEAIALKDNIVAWDASGSYGKKAKSIVADILAKGNTKIQDPEKELTNIDC